MSHGLAVRERVNLIDNAQPNLLETVPLEPPEILAANEVHASLPLFEGFHSGLTGHLRVDPVYWHCQALVLERAFPPHHCG